MTNKLKLSYKIITLIFLATFLAACGTTQYMQSESGNAKNMAKINIYRKSAFWGSAVSAPVYVNNNYIGRIGNGGNLNWTVKPGLVTVSTSTGVLAAKLSNKASAVTFQAVKGRVYNVEVSAPYQLTAVATAFEVELVN